ncbi:hypothetical protein FOL46_008348 [Perkinsus olseni]|uniref:Uncharacterized protein n=1 Tax=Perkinsus olseni TaxID=32597 RepID=A0A7J6MMI2_PEROL|nr:hypothetical protein FOL46_008348 [Perkinsus olseni]
MRMSVALVVLVLAYFSPVVALIKYPGRLTPPDGEYTVTYGAPSFLSMNATIDTVYETIHITFVCEDELPGYDHELKYEVWGGGGQFTLGTCYASGYVPMMNEFAQLCRKFGNGHPAAQELCWFDVGAKIMKTTVAGINVTLERSG